MTSIQDRGFQGCHVGIQRSEGNVHGPFTINQMRTWYQLNFFFPEVPHATGEAKSPSSRRF